MNGYEDTSTDRSADAHGTEYRETWGEENRRGCDELDARQGVDSSAHLKLEEDTVLTAGTASRRGTRLNRGQFEDKKGVTLDHVLVITQTSDAGKALVFYIYGKQPKWRIKKSGCWPRIGMIDSDTLTLPWRNRIKVTYVFDDDGTASVKYVSKRKDGTTRTTRGKVALKQ